jgi:hypothetical protein
MRTQKLQGSVHPTSSESVSSSSSNAIDLEEELGASDDEAMPQSSRDGRRE